MEVSLEGLARGEFFLVLGVAGGVALGKVLLALELPGRVLGTLKPVMRRWRIPGPVVFALAVSLGSSRAGVAIVAEASRSGRLGSRETVYGTLLQSFPGYVKRWAVSFPVTLGLAGVPGAVFSSVILARSFCRFLFFLSLLRRNQPEDGEFPLASPSGHELPFLKSLARTLPPACVFHALAYFLSPALQSFLEEKGASLPLLSGAGWTVAAASFASANAALGLAGGVLASGSLTGSQAVLALLAGNMLAVLSRVLRQDIAFWIGLYPAGTVRVLFLWNLATLLVTMAATVLLAALPVMWGW